ncbi:MAG: acyl-CoA dehydrogenase family protein, partial [Myxococcota bacterium]
MDFELSDDQRAIAAAVEALLEKHAGAARAIELAPTGAVDSELGHALAEAGFAEVALGDETGALEAVLVVEAVARACGVVSAGAEILVAPAVAGRSLRGPVALVEAGRRDPVRFGAHARTALLLDGDIARVVSLEPADAAPVKSSFGYPMGRLAIPSGRGESLGAGTGAALRSW